MRSRAESLRAGRRRERGAFRAELVWIAGLLLALLLGVWWFPGKARDPDDTYSVDPAGKRALFEVATELFPGTRRVHDDLGLALTDDGLLWSRDEALCIIGPAAYPAPHVWELLADWVREGNALLVAARHDDPALDLEPFGLRITSLDEPPSSESQPPRTQLVTGVVDWSSNGRIEWDGPAAMGGETLLRWRGTPQVVRERIGAGVVVVVATDSIFTNLALATERRGVLAVRILEQLEVADGLAFDESLNAYGGAKVFGWLFDPLFRPLTLQVIIIALLFAWRGSKRFGPAVAEERYARRSYVEHAVALGNLHYKASTGVSAVKAYLEYLRYELRLHYALRSGVDEATLLARRAGRDEAEIAQLVREVASLTDGAKISHTRAASLVRSLATLKSLTDRTEGEPDGA